MSNDVQKEPGSELPDFVPDEPGLAAYERAKQNYIAALTQEAELQLRDTFEKRRAEINEEIENLRNLAWYRSSVAAEAAATYAAKLPHRVRKTGVLPPSFWERLVTFNAVGTYYRAAAKAAAEQDEVNEALRKRRDRLDTVEREMRRSIYLREDAVRKKLQTPEGLAALHADPLVKSALAKIKAAADERAYAERLKNGQVGPEEARDHDMAQYGLTFAAVPLEGVMISRIVRYGSLEYYVLCDLENREYVLSCDPVLEPLRDFVFDVSRSADGYEAALRSMPDGAPMRVFDRLKASHPNDEAAERYALHSTVLRADRPAQKTAPRDHAEAELTAMLGLLAAAVLERSRSAVPVKGGQAGV